jgi:predicted DCC family thiol-disulfide oxidoreductase YuxK
LRRTLAFLRDRYLSADPRSLGFFRIFFGLCLAIDLLRRLPVMRAFYTNDGVLSNHFALFRPVGKFSIYNAFSTPGEVAIAFALTLVIYGMYILGWHTKFAQIASFICLTSLHSRNTMLENGGDVVMNIVACWSMFLPLGRRFSIDALRDSWRNTDEHSPGDLNLRRVISNSPAVSLAIFAFICQFAVIWAFNAGNKIGMTWKDGSAIYWVLHQQRLITPFGSWAGQHAPYWVLRLMTWSTLAIEASAPVLFLLPIWQRWARWIGLFGVWALHIGIGVTTNIKLFQLSMMSFPLLLIGALDWKAFAAWHRKRTGEITLVYDTDCGVCHQSARIIKRLDSLAQITFVGNDDDARRPASVSRELADRTAVVVQGDKQWIRAAAFAKMFRTLPGWAPLGWFLSIPGFAQLANLCYDVFARNRHKISRWLGMAACGVPQPAPAVAMAAGGAEPPSIIRSIPRIVFREGLVLLVFVVCVSQVLVENAGPRRIFHINQPQWMSDFIWYPRIAQGWGMFAPDAPVDDGNIVIDALTTDGRHIDPITRTTPIMDDVAPPGGKYPMQPQWCDYFNRIRLPGNAVYRAQFRDYLLRLWTMERRPPEDRIVSMDVWWVSHQTVRPGEKVQPPPAKEKVLSYP